MSMANAGPGDRLVRFIIGLVLLGLALGGVLSGPMTVLALVAAVLMLGTAVFGYCPLYTLVHIDTRDLGLPKPRT